MSFAEKAVALHGEQGFNCCQAVACSACHKFGMDMDTGYRLGAFFGGGMRRGEVCGCVSDALMVLGLKYGDENNRQSMESQHFMKAFEEKFGALPCRDLIKAHGKRLCPELIAFAAAYLEDHVL